MTNARNVYGQQKYKKKEQKEITKKLSTENIYVPLACIFISR